MDVVIATVVLAAISALGTLAYKDPEGFDRLTKGSRLPGYIIAAAGGGIALGGAGAAWGFTHTAIFIIGNAIALSICLYFGLLDFFTWLRGNQGKGGSD